MSEQTPDASNGLVGGEEPSMEDILASIRKIIADDESGAEALTLPNELIADAETEFSDIQTTETAESDFETLDLDILAASPPLDDEIDTLISDIDMSDDPIESLVETQTEDLVSDDVLELEIPDVQDNLTEDLPVEAAAAAIVSAPAAMLATETVAEDSEVFDDDLSLMLDDMLADDDNTEGELSDNHDLSGTLELDEVIDPSAELLSDDLLSDDLPSESVDIDDDYPMSDSLESDADIDLVKSLMAELSEQPIHDDDDISLEADDDTETDNILDEILSLSLDDEIELQNEDQDEIVEDVLSLKDIAAQAEADANAIDGGDGVAVAAGLAAMGATAKVLNDTDDEPEIDSIDADDDIDEALAKFDDIVDTQPETNTDIKLNEETPEMPRAAKKDTIIDEVTETATADVFASLNQVVEDKAVVAERGDRIGDLVQEALRPMLKEWLDKNLKGIVERAVTKEVKRISSGK